MKTSKPLTFTTIPAWALPTTPSVESLFVTLALAGLEGKWLRLNADTQRALLGCVPFGKREVRINDGSEVEVFVKCGFGQDGDSLYYTPAEVGSLVEAEHALVARRKARREA